MTTTLRRRWYQFSLKTVLVLVAVVAVGVAASIAYDRWYAAKHPRLHAYRVLHQSIKDGDSIDKVQRLLPGSVAADAEQTSLYAKMIRRGMRAPEGYKPDDFLLVYKVERNVITLQFRDGVLINHDPNDFADPHRPIVWGLSAIQPVKEVVKEVKEATGRDPININRYTSPDQPKLKTTKHGRDPVLPVTSPYLTANNTNAVGRYQFVDQTQGVNTQGMLIDTATGHCWFRTGNEWHDVGNPTSPPANIKDASGLLHVDPRNINPALPDSSDRIR